MELSGFVLQAEDPAVFSGRDLLLFPQMLTDALLSAGLSPDDAATGVFYPELHVPASAGFAVVGSGCNYSHPLILAHKPRRLNAPRQISPFRGLQSPIDRLY